jgi:hypothetical protein
MLGMDVETTVAAAVDFVGVEPGPKGFVVWSCGEKNTNYDRVSRPHAYQLRTESNPLRDNFAEDPLVSPVHGSPVKHTEVYS